MNDRTPAPAVEVRGLTKSYGSKQVLAGLDLTVPSGTVLALLGPNGAGKTTTVEILQGLRRCDDGEVRVLGEEPRRAGRAWRARLGVVSQSSQDHADLTVAEAVTASARFYAEPADVGATIARVGLADDVRTRSGRLSGGRRRRLDVALALIGRPELLFLDEPTTGFDPEARHEFWDLIAGLRDEGTTILLTTHYLDEAAHLADEVAVVLGGRVAEHGTVAELARSAGSECVVSWVEAGTPRSARTDRPTSLVSELASRLVDADGEVPGLEVRPPTLEDHYLALVAAAEAEDDSRGSAA